MYTLKQLQNGIRLVYEHLPYLRSVSVGVWIENGSRNESELYWGASHFIEHMLFKGTTTRSAKDIAEEMDSIGGHLNAFTSQECTCFYTKTLDRHIETAFSLLSDMLNCSLLADKDIEMERGVIIEEINMCEDNPEDLAMELLSGLCYSSHPAGRNILGSVHSIENFTGENLRRYMQGNYTAENTVISVAGNFDAAALEQMAEKYFEGYNRNALTRPIFPAPEFHKGEIDKIKDIEQAHICVAYPGISSRHPDYYTMLAINSVLGGGMSSILFQKIREEKGLAYSVYSYPVVLKDAGYFSLYAGCAPRYMQEVTQLMLTQTQELRREGIGDDLLGRTKEQLSGGYILSSENTGSRMNAMGRQLLLYGSIKTEDETLRRIDAISQDSVRRTLDLVLGSEPSLVVLHP